MSKKVLLTGAGGSIGAQFIIHFMENTDWDIIALDSFHHKGYRDRLERIYKDHPEWKPRIKEFQHDLVCSIPPKMQEDIGEVDYILHLAALSDVFFSVDNPVYVIQNNINSTLTMLEYARKAKPDMFLYFSTDETMGPVEKGDAHAENEPHRPSNAYAASKAACEDICHAYWRSYGIPLVITRTMNNFSSMQSSSKFPVMIQKALQNDDEVIIHGNEQEIGSRFYIHSRNAADAVFYIINNKPSHIHAIGEIDEPDIYHVVGQVNWTNLELAQIIAKLMDKELRYKLVDFHHDNPGHDIHYGLQDNKLRTSGWIQPIDDVDSLKQTIDWQTENPEWMK